MRKGPLAVAVIVLLDDNDLGVAEEGPVSWTCPCLIQPLRAHLLSRLSALQKDAHLTGLEDLWHLETTAEEGCTSDVSACTPASDWKRQRNPCFVPLAMPLPILSHVGPPAPNFPVSPLSCPPLLSSPSAVHLDYTLPSLLALTFQMLVAVRKEWKQPTIRVQTRQQKCNSGRRPFSSKSHASLGRNPRWPRVLPQPNWHKRRAAPVEREPCGWGNYSHAHRLPGRETLW